MNGINFVAGRSNQPSFGANTRIFTETLKKIGREGVDSFIPRDLSLKSSKKLGLKDQIVNIRAAVETMIKELLSRA